MDSRRKWFSFSATRNVSESRPSTRQQRSPSQPEALDLTTLSVPLLASPVSVSLQGLQSDIVMPLLLVDMYRNSAEVSVGGFQSILGLEDMDAIEVHCGSFFPTGS